MVPAHPASKPPRAQGAELGGLIPVHVPKALLLLTAEEYARALARGKAYRRAEALTRRMTTATSHTRATRP